MQLKIICDIPVSVVLIALTTSIPETILPILINQQVVVYKRRR